MAKKSARGSKRKSKKSTRTKIRRSVKREALKTKIKKVEDRLIESVFRGIPFKTRDGNVFQIGSHDDEYDDLDSPLTPRRPAEIDRTRYWKTEDGEILLIQAMEEEHLRNCISFLARKLSNMLHNTAFLTDSLSFTQSLAAMLLEAKRRGYRV